MGIQTSAIKIVYVANRADFQCIFNNLFCDLIERDSVKQKYRYHDSYQRFVDHIFPAQSVVIIPHDYPDPDALGAAAGLQYLLQQRGISRCDIAFAGFVGRAENRVMVETLNLRSKSLGDIDLSEYDKVIMVDTVPSNGNASLVSPEDVDAVLDHHAVTDFEVKNTDKTLYEVHHTLGATSTLVTYFLLAAKLGIPAEIATGLFYGIKTDTKNMGRNCFDADLFAFKYLFDLIDHQALSRIENPPREPEYLELLQRASAAMQISEDFGYTHLGTVSMPDFVPEMADVFHSLKQLEWMVASAFFNNQIIFSVRSKESQEAGLLTQKFTKILGGSGGGHPTVAAGRVPIAEGQSDVEALTIFVTTLKQVFGIGASIELSKLL